jgi:hypothetical protein
MNDAIFVPALTATSLVALVNVFVTLVVQYMPGLNVKFGALASETKKQIFLGLALVTGVAWFVLGGLQLPPAWNVIFEPMSVASFLSAMAGVILGIGGGQGTFTLLPTAKDVALAKGARG